MSYLFFLLAMGPLAAVGIYPHHVMDGGVCHAEPGSYMALYCPAGAKMAQEPTYHLLRHKRPAHGRR